MVNLEGLKLNYPCEWKYKAILESRYDIKSIVKDLFGNRDYTLKESHESKRGKYQSHTITTLVCSDKDRKTLFDELKSHKSIKFIL